ncbi:hypothetical protein HUS70_07875 [Pandoraea nosoerga]|uniref:Activation/secretion protein n=1 Tax=Pandoraea nosoerga TaxID=2508296 RepID=A0A5E4XTX4_9BURK|nr:ShlB/FhaC/HecB family hemolysin secretion/activation protein [Pandoraea nosoerga]MBN4667542.1 hypothetical protein [Pandoraea nosoerga]MBN4674872.1 hypothetical protein [Pandoraea nosoerga]MBN4680188.1 hypothetical protein [Pandoraea nosoerga]MBN4744578.1 hypothetical protein [Pandoraea nosoerga]VVE39723.1 activation/secretion protein [Pandoraea nosoerga]
MLVKPVARSGLLLAVCLVVGVPPGAHAQSLFSDPNPPCFTEQNAVSYGLWDRGLAPQYFAPPPPPPEPATPAAPAAAQDPDAAADPIALFAGADPNAGAQAVDREAAQRAAAASGATAGVADGAAPLPPLPSPSLAAADFAVSPELSADGTAISAVDIDAPVAAPDTAAQAPAPDVAPPNAFLARASCLRGLPRHESLADRNIRMLMRRGLVMRDEQLPFVVTRSRTPGEGAVGLQVLNERPYQFNVGVNNSGMTTTGKMQGTANLLMNNPLGMSGRFNTTLSQDLQNARHDATNRDLIASYSVPIDAEWTVGITGKTNAATDQLASATTQTQTLQWRVRRAFDFTPNGSTGIELRYNRSRTEDPNAIHTYDSYAEVGLSHTHYLGTSKLDLSVMQRLNAPWMPASSGPPGWSYRFQSIDAKLTVPF